MPRAERMLRGPRRLRHSGQVHAKPRAAARPGFTLLEALIAVTVVALAGVAALAAFGAGLRTAARARHAVEAAALADDRLTALALVAPDALTSLPDSGAGGSFPAPLGAYAWRATAAAVLDEPGLYDLAVEVTWPEGAYAVRTRVYRPPRVVTSGALAFSREGAP